MGPINSSVNNFIGPTSGLSFEPKAAGANGAGGPNFMDALRDTFARETGKLTGISLPNLPGNIDNTVFTPNSSKTSTVV